MKNSLLQCKTLLTLLLLSVLTLLSQAATKTWNGGTGTGKSWTTAANWSPAVAPVAGDDIVFDMAGSITFSTMPASVAYNSLTINQGTVILAGATGTKVLTLGASGVTGLSIASGATLTLGTPICIFMASGSLGTISGTLTVGSASGSACRFNTKQAGVVTTVTGSILNYGFVTSKTATNLLFNGTSQFTESNAAATDTIPTATWASTSTITIAAAFTSAVTLDGFTKQTYGNVVYNCPGQTSTVSLFPGLSANAYTTNIAGNFTITSTNTGTLYFRITGSQITGVNLNLAGNFLMSAGTLDMNNSGLACPIAFNIGGDFTFSGGTIKSTSTTSGSTSTINFAKSGTQTYTESGSPTFLGNATNKLLFNVNSGTTLLMASPTTVLDGANCNFTLATGSYLGVNSTDGISTSGVTGNIQVSGTRSFSSGNIIYNGTGTQNTGNGIAAVTSISITNTAGRVTFNALAAVAGTISLAASSTANLGSYSHSAQTLTLDAATYSTGSYGGNSSAATNKNATFFPDTETGKISVGGGACTTGTWIGLVSTEWNNANNWCNTTLPDASTDVIIRPASFQPNISTAAVCKNISINSGALLTISGANSLTASGSFTNSGSFIINGGTLNVSGNFSNTGSFNGNTGTINANSGFANTGTFLAGSSTVNFTGAAQSITGNLTTFYNATVKGTGLKTITTNNFAVNNVFSMEATGTISAVPFYGLDATLQYNKTGSFTSSVEWPATFVALGGVAIRNSGTISLNAGKTFTSCPLKVYDGSVLAMGANAISGVSALNLYCGASGNGSSITGTGLLTLSGDVNVTSAGVGTGGATVSCPVVLTNASTRTFTVADDGSGASDLTQSGIISTSGSIIKSGAGLLTLTNIANTYSGSTTVMAGEFRVNPTTTAATAVSQLNMNRGVFSSTSILDGTTLTNSATLMLSDNSTLNLGSNAHSLKFLDSHLISWTGSRYLVINGWTGSVNTSGTAGKLFVGTTNTGLSAGQLAEIKFYISSAYYNATQLGTGEVVPSGPLSASAFVSVMSGNWGNPATWGYAGSPYAGLTYPGTTDDVTIAGNHTITLTATTSTSGSLTFSGAGTLSMGSYDMTVGAFTAGNSSGTATVSSSAGTFTMSGALTTTAGGTLDLTSTMLAGTPSGVTGNGTILTRNTSSTPLPTGIIWGGTVSYNSASTAQTAMAGTYNNLTIATTGGATASGNITVNGELNMVANPAGDGTHGALELVSGWESYPSTGNATPSAITSYTLTMGLNSNTTGTGDVSGIIARTHTISANTPYSFGNQFTTITITNGTSPTLPSSITVVAKIGVAPGGKSGAVRRSYQIIPASNGANCFVAANFHYLDTELQTNTEAQLVTWDYDLDGGFSSPDEHGRAAYDFTNNYVGMSNIPIDYFIYVAGTHAWRTIFELGDHASAKYLRWNGSTSTDWTVTSNWTPSGNAPDATCFVIIPNASTTPNDPILPPTAEVNTMTIESGGILTMGSSTLTIKNSLSAGWEDQNAAGNDPGTSTVVFANSGATVSGTGRFHNLTINSGASLTNAANATVKIAGAITKTGNWYADVAGGTVEYNGAAQTVVLPDGTPSYHNLTLSGTGTKTFPYGTMTLDGDFTNNGSGTIDPNGGIVNMIGLSDQSIGGTGTISLHNLTISNTNGSINAISNISTELLTINSGSILNMTTNILSANLAFSSTGSANGILKTQNISSTTPIPTTNNWDFKVIYNASSAQSVSQGQYSSLQISNPTTSTATGTIQVNKLTIDSGSTFRMGLFELSNSAPVVTTNGSGLLQTLNTIEFPIPKAQSWSFDVEYNGTAQTISDGSYQNLTLSGSDTKTLPSAATTIAGNLTIGSGVTASGAAGTINLAGNLLNSGALSLSAGTLVLNGSIAQTISGAGTSGFNNLTLNNGLGLSLSADADASVFGSLALTSGKITTGSRNLVLQSAATISGAGSGQYVFGNLRRFVPTGSVNNFALPIGDENNYTPVSVDFAGSITGTGYLDASTSIPASSPDAASKLNQAKYINRYWTLTNTDVGGFSSASPTFTFVTGDVLGTTNTDNLIVAKLSSATWTIPTVGTKTSTSTQATGVVTFGDFYLGEAASGSNDYYRSTGTSGNWSETSAWQSSADGSTNWIPATMTPTNSSTGIAISSGTTINIDDAASASNLTISGGTLASDSGVAFEVYANWVNNGSFIPGTGSVTFDSGSSQSISGSSVTTFNNLNTGTGGGMTTINAGIAVNVGGTLNTNNHLSINSGTLTNYGSLIVSGSSTGTVTYHLGLDNALHLISAPISSPSYGSDVLTYLESTNSWNKAPVGSLASGIGYGLKLGSSGSIQLTGTLVGDLTSAALPRSEVGGKNSGWNLIGNPYSSAMDMYGFLSANSAKLHSSYVAVYVWDGGTYKALSNGGFTPPAEVGTLTEQFVQVGQGFFAKIGTAGNTLSFAKTMQSHQTSVSLKSANTAGSWAGVQLKAVAGSSMHTTIVTYHSGMTTGLDPGYDVGLFSSGGEIELSTRLVEDNGYNFMIQAVPDTQLDKNVVPVAVNFLKGGTVTFSGFVVDLPGGTKIYLEDRIANVRTDLSTSAYTVTLPANTAGTGRFFIIPGNLISAVENNEVKPKELTVWYANRQINIGGNQSGKAIANLFDISGKLLYQFKLPNVELNQIGAPSRCKGIYLLQILDGNKQTIHKLVID